jgi:hypothetical protein
MAYYSSHPMQDVIERNEWAYTRQIIMHSTAKWKPIKVTDMLLTWKTGKPQTQAEIDANLKMVKAALK